MTDADLGKSVLNAEPRVPAAPSVDGLIARLESASHGSIELSAEIERDVMGRMVHEWPFWFRATSFDGIENSAVVPVTPYTTSLDAAMTLVPEGWFLDLHDWRWAEEPRWNAALQNVRGTYENVNGQSPNSAALALCIAALKARQAMPQPEPVSDRNAPNTDTAQEPTTGST